jgi:magnesium-transporting ATPase (P-type)
MSENLMKEEVELLYDRIRAKIEHEDNLVNQRIMWMVTLQGLLFTAYVFSLSAEATALNVPSSDKVSSFISTLTTLRQAMVALGVGSSFATLLGVIAAHRAIRDDERTLRRGQDNCKSAPKTFPNPIGRRVTNIIGMICGLSFPFIGTVVWMWIGRLLPNPLIVIVALVVIFVMGIVIWPFIDFK